MDNKMTAAGERPGEWDSTPEELWREWRRLEAAAKKQRKVYADAKAAARTARANYDKKMDAAVGGLQTFGDIENE